MRAAGRGGERSTLHLVHERYDGADGHKGESFSIYDASRRVWHQSWVANRGELLVVEGKFQDGKMVLAGADRTADGRERRVRGTWKAEGDAVRETAVATLAMPKSATFTSPR